MCATDLLLKIIILLSREILGRKKFKSCFNNRFFWIYWPYLNILLKKWLVIGLDAMTDYYDINLKKSKKTLEENVEFHSYTGLIQDKKY